MSMGPEAPVEYQTRTTENEQRVDSTNELIQHDLERCDFKVHWTDFLRTIALYGTGIAKVEYAKETATVMVKERKRSMFAGMMGMFSKMFGGQQAPAEQESFRPETVRYQRLGDVQERRPLFDLPSAAHGRLFQRQLGN
jgi:hypothetical protein